MSQLRAWILSAQRRSFLLSVVRPGQNNEDRRGGVARGVPRRVQLRTTIGRRGKMRALPEGNVQNARRAGGMSGLSTRQDNAEYGIRCHRGMLAARLRRWHVFECHSQRVPAVQEGHLSTGAAEDTLHPVPAKYKYQRTVCGKWPARYFGIYIEKNRLLIYNILIFMLEKPFTVTLTPLTSLEISCPVYRNLYCI